jgi:hypothetical protein
MPPVVNITLAPALIILSTRRFVISSSLKAAFYTIIPFE